MRIGNAKYQNQTQACIATPKGIVRLEAVNTLTGSHWPLDLETLLQTGEIEALTGWYLQEGHSALNDSTLEILPEKAVTHVPPIRRPGKIWGIGLNYVAHAGDLDAHAPEEIPARFIWRPYRLSDFRV